MAMTIVIVPQTSSLRVLTMKSHTISAPILSLIETQENNTRDEATPTHQKTVLTNSITQSIHSTGMGGTEAKGTHEKPRRSK